MTTLVNLKDVKKDYLLGRTRVAALRGITLSIESGEFLAIVGPSGSGKTTLLNVIGCMDVPSSGELMIDGRAVAAMSDRQRTQLRLNCFGFIFQNFNLMPALTVQQNVELPLLLAGSVAAGHRRHMAAVWLNKVGLVDRAGHRPSELSGGQQQRVAIARALIGKPKLVLADEPTGNLDTNTGKQIIELMRTIALDNNTTFVFSTHDPKVMAAATRTVTLIDGCIEQDAA